MLERELSGDTEAGGIEVGGYRSRDLERSELERELSWEAEGCTQRRRLRSGKEEWDEEEEEEEEEGRKGGVGLSLEI